MQIQFKAKLKNLNGSDLVFSNENLAGEPHLLLFYHTHCLGCTGRAIPLAYEFQKQYSTLKVLLIHANLGVHQLQQQEILSVFVEGKSPLPIYVDENASLYKQFNAEGTPHWIFLNEKGEVENSIFGSQANAQNRLMYSLDGLN